MKNLSNHKISFEMENFPVSLNYVSVDDVVLCQVAISSRQEDLKAIHYLKRGGEGETSFLKSMISIPLEYMSMSLKGANMTIIRK